MLKSFILLILGILVSQTLATHKVPEFTVSNKELICLARNIYHEARGEAYKGQLAVAIVTLNRVKSKKYSNSICGVVYQHKQFSWTLNKNKITDRAAWDKAIHVAQYAIVKYDDLKTFKATHYHHIRIKPRWGLQKVAKIGNHVFYA